MRITWKNRPRILQGLGMLGLCGGMIGIVLLIVSVALVRVLTVGFLGLLGVLVLWSLVAKFRGGHVIEISAATLNYNNTGWMMGGRSFEVPLKDLSAIAMDLDASRGDPQLRLLTHRAQRTVQAARETASDDGGLTLREQPSAGLGQMMEHARTLYELAGSQIDLADLSWADRVRLEQTLQAEIARIASVAVK